MDEIKRQTLINKKCKLVQTNGFILEGTVIDIDQYGFMFKTTQKTSFIAWTNVRELTPGGSEF
jgi:sRNA-binding regulator protein Hfq